MENPTPTRLPIVEYEGTRWYFDARLRQIRNVDNPHVYQDLDDVKLAYFAERVTRSREEDTARVVWKDEGRDANGQSIGPAHTEHTAGEIVENHGWITWKQAKAIAEDLGVDLQES